MPGDDCLGIRVACDGFAAHLKILKRHFTVISMDELAGQLKARALEPHTIVLTFDDGYRDNYLHALPVLRAQGLSATFFIPTDFVGDERPVPDARLERLVESTTARRLPMPDGEVLSLATPHDRRLAAHRLLRRMVGLSVEGREAMLGRLGEELGVREQAAGEADRPLSWTELRDMQRQGMALGSHSCSHRSLTGLPPEEALRELATSRGRLERRLGTEVRFLSYPYGRRRDVNRQVVRGAEKAGYELACTASPGRVEATSPRLRLRRLNVEDWRPRELLFQVERALYGRSVVDGGES